MLGVILQLCHRFGFKQVKVEQLWEFDKVCNSLSGHILHSNQLSCIGPLQGAERISISQHRHIST